MKRTFFSLLTLALLSINTAWAADGVSATQTFTNGRATCTWTNMNVTVSKNATAGGDGLYFVAGGSGTIATDNHVVNIKSGRTMYVQVPSASSHGTITIVGSQDKGDRSVSLNSGLTIVMSTDGASANFVATDVDSGKPRYFTKKDIFKNDSRPFKATCALPVLCRPITLEGHRYCDGGVSDSLPGRIYLKNRTGENPSPADADEGYQLYLPRQKG